MVDVLHTLFEDDVRPTWEGDQQVKSKLRSHIYETLYKKPYKYAVETSRSADSFDPEMMDLPPEQMPTKPYIPPTDPADLPGLLNAPLG